MTDAADTLEAALTAAAVGGDTEALRSVLHGDVRWGDCHGADAVIAMFRSMRNNGMDATSIDTERLDDRVVATIQVMIDDAEAPFHMAFITDDDKVRHILLAATADDARTMQPDAAPQAPTSRARFQRSAPVFPVEDAAEAGEHYRALGFEVEIYGGGANYGFATRDGIEIHLAGHQGIDPLTTTSAAYVWVDDAAALHAEWSNAGRSGRYRTPEPTDYGLLEGAHIDPWGNLIRYGSPI